MSERTDNSALTEAVYYILLSLYQPLHGYGIMQKVERLSNGRVLLAAGTLYGAISALLDRKWIEAIQGEVTSRKKEYQITSTGRDVVEIEIDRLRELLINGEAIVKNTRSTN